MALYFSQSKSYLKIIDISYIREDTNFSINSSNVKSIIQSMHIFNNMCLASKPHVIKALPKSNMVIIWIDIWNAQSSSKAKTLINKRFNIRRFITTIRDANMNLDIPQCKNCWK